jgi:hypothetical protein
MPARQADSAWTERFLVEPGELVSTGRNPYFVLEPGYRLVLEGGDRRLTITVLSETRTVDGIESRIVEERETSAGALVEVSRNYYALSRRSNSVFYLGEAVDMYRNGRIIGHQGSWVAGSNGARFGLMMPGQPLVDGRYYQEQAPGIAMDRARIAGMSGSIRTRAGGFSNILKIEETTPLEPKVKEYKLYAAGVGLIQDGDLKLVSYGPRSD